MKFYEDKEYIKMCKSASKNLPTVAPTIGLPDGELFYYSYNHTLYKMDGWLFPLYRQDQLQEMLEMYDPEDLMEELQASRKSFQATIEQTLLAILMYVEHNKIWNGEEWVSE